MEDFKGQIRSLKGYGNDFWEFYNKQTKKVQDRILWTIRVIKDIQLVPEKYLKHIDEGIYEIRVSSGNNIFRIFCFFDEGQLVIVLNGFQKKTQKTPTEEIDKAKKLKRNIMKAKKNNLVDLEEFIDKDHGKRGTKRRDKFEEGYEAFKLGVMMQEMRLQRNMTQEQLAEKCGTTKNYISRIENDASDIRLSTLMRIVREGFGGHLKLSVNL
ncbi:MAG: type II toxin-antitoxin system RelE/ParE family toxin [Sediminibacterium sp.]|nr:type II toxin-antitoxin system RelE/ParE family toxin [Sediminibacterium sp.]MDP3129463.1 type II toxin-antitoxin system RelE/ParE family toxin [Sediminibacterium sp.]